MFYWIYDQPSAAVGLVFALGFLAFVWLATLLFHRYFHPWFHTEGRANDMVGFALSSFSVFYGILVGLIAVAAYQNFGNLEDVVTREASSLAAMYRDLGGYPQPERSRLQGWLRDYTRYEIERDWPQLQHGIVPWEGSHRLEQFMDELLAFEPRRTGEQLLHAEALRQLNSFMDLRQVRLTNVEVGIPAVMWWVVGIGAFIVLLLVAMLDMDIHVHLTLGAALSVFLGLVIFLTAEMDHPFRGHVSVGPDAFRSVYTRLMQPNDAVSKAIEHLIANTGRLGGPRLQGTVVVAGKAVPGLYFGDTRVNNSFDLVDRAVRDTGCTASLFVRSGDQYIRVASDVRKSDGTLAIGTILDPNGPAIRKIRQGDAYYGEATILGKPFITGYEPIKDSSGTVIGVYGADRNL